MNSVCVVAILIKIDIMCKMCLCVERVINCEIIWSTLDLESLLSRALTVVNGILLFFWLIFVNINCFFLILNRIEHIICLGSEECWYFFLYF